MATSYAGTKVLVTGADGFIGSHLTEALVSSGGGVTALAQYNSFDSHGWLDDLPESVRDTINLVRGDIRDAGVEYFVVPVEKTNQKTVPDLKNAVTRGKFTLNFKPKAKVGARVALTIQKPGIYLLRVQSENTNSDHEHFSAIDVIAE